MRSRIRSRVLRGVVPALLLIAGPAVHAEADVSVGFGKLSGRVIRSLDVAP